MRLLKFLMSFMPGALVCLLLSLIMPMHLLTISVFSFASMLLLAPWWGEIVPGD